jgi:AraC family transcriptional regulator
MIDQAELRREAYVGRVNRAVDYVRGHLAGDLRLEAVAQAAGFSPFHFHRVFRAMTGETLNDCIRRLRVQRAASQLIYSPSTSITRIGAECGYSSPSAFAREFRHWFGVSASQFRAGGEGSVRRFRTELEARGQAFVNPADLRSTRTAMSFRVDVRELPRLHVAYVRHIGHYSEIGKAFSRLMRWAGPRGLTRSPEAVVLAVYHDNPNVTPIDKLQADACITVPEGTKVKGEVGLMSVPGGTFAVAHVEIDERQYGEAWDRLIGDWMPQSGYQPDERLCYERYLNDPAEHPEAKHIVEICEPIRPL